jgi:hypothetical protein
MGEEAGDVGLALTGREASAGEQAASAVSSNRIRMEYLRISFNR